MAVAIITGSGAHALPGLVVDEVVSLPPGSTSRSARVEVTQGRLGGVEVLHLSRHGDGHARLSHQVTHRENVRALRELGASAVIGCTACGAVDPEIELGTLIVFDDLHFPSNRLPDGSLCTVFSAPGEEGRGHWVLHGGPFSPRVREALSAAADEAGHRCVHGGTYGHVDGPRFNTPSEIAALATAGVIAVSQTGGPETVLCGELELPYALIGFVTDHANEVRPGQTTPVATLRELMSHSPKLFADVVTGAVRRLRDEAPAPAGTMLRFGPA